ncbi:MAG: alpha/beta hydrolase, partial [Gemmatimonadaceae bacterium]
MNIVRAVAITLATLAGAVAADAQGSTPSTRPTIVLVHGAFADASGWLDVIPLLQQDGYKVVAVQNPLASL